MQDQTVTQQEINDKFDEIDAKIDEVKGVIPQKPQE